MKLLFQLVGFAVILLILLSAVLFYMESQDLLEGDLAEFIRQMRSVWLSAKETILSFLHTSGIADDAADLLDQGADKLRATESPEPSAPPETPEAPVPSAPPESTNFSASIVISTPMPN